MLLKLKKNRKGFTLIELIVVVAIIAILAAIAIPNFIGMQKRAQDSVDQANASAMCNAINVYNALVDGTTTAKIADVAKGSFAWDATTTTLAGKTLDPKFGTSFDDAAKGRAAGLISIAGGVAKYDIPTAS